MKFYLSRLDQVENLLQTSLNTGLTADIGKVRLEKDGQNEIASIQKKGMFYILLEQFKNLLVILLIVAALLSLYLGSLRDATVLFIIVIINSCIGFYQDWKSENILASLTTLIVDKCIVIRGGVQKEIPVKLLVKGDLVLLKEGDGVPADIRLIWSTGLLVNEFILTGESQPREKDATVVLEEEIAIAQRDNCIFMGTSITKGEARGIVYATGMETELGKIAKSSSTITQDISPLQKEMNRLAYKITVATLGLGAVLFLLRLSLQDTISEALVFAIGIAAAMVPEGLPAQISIALSLGVQKLAKRNAIVKKLSSVEALGAATVIASDKTGTITKNEMTITFAHVAGENFKITGTGFEPKGEIYGINSHLFKNKNLTTDQKLAFIAGYLASTARVNPPDEFHNSWYPLGDPTECAFATLALKAGYNLELLEKEYKQIQLFSFDSERKRMSIIRDQNGRHISMVKGSIESLLEVSAFLVEKGEVKKLEEEDKKNLLALSKAHAANGLRIIALAYKEFASPQPRYCSEDAEHGLIFIGFVCMQDPPHQEVKKAIQAAYKANIRVIMITGDNEITAMAIAEQIGLKNADGSIPRIITENRLKELKDTELANVLHERSLIFSRVSPDEKLRIVSLLKNKEEVVAVTGDGVNDTLSLKKADIGVAMGLKGSKIAQEAATMVLLDDNFSTIMYAIKEGRTIYKNIQKNVLATLASNVAELSCVLFGLAGLYFNFPVVILAIHILLIDLIGEMLPLLALSFDPPEKSLMTELPRKPGQMIDKKILLQVLFSGLIRGAIAIWAFFQVYAINNDNPIQNELAVTATFVTIILTQFVNILSIRTKKSIFTRHLFSNGYLYAGMLFSLTLLAGIVYIPSLNLFLHTGPLTLQDLQYPFWGAAFYLLLTENIKFIKHHRGKKANLILKEQDIGAATSYSLIIISFLVAYSHFVGGILFNLG